jgi:small-conductance mechanosensitive channel
VTTTPHRTAPNVGSRPELRTEQRIARLTLVIGLVAGAAAASTGHWSWASGLILGAALAWLNFCWLRRALDALVATSTAQKGAERPRVPVGTYLRAMFRYALIALAVYVIFKVLKVPLASMVFGLCALGAATIAASVYEIWHPVEQGVDPEPDRGTRT